MSKSEAIEIIQALYPADAEYDGARQVGRNPMERAKRETSNYGWRDMSDAALIRYAELCQARAAAATTTVSSGPLRLAIAILALGAHRAAATRLRCGRPGGGGPPRRAIVPFKPL